MNANELADELEKTTRHRKDTVFTQAAAMLRQQQAEIESFKGEKNIVPDEMEDQEVQFTLEVVKENPDGSADCEMRCNPYTSGKLLEIALISLLKKHIEQEKRKKKAWWKIW